MARPPALARWLLAAVLGPGPVGRSVLADLDEEFAHRARAARARARWWYRREAAGVAMRVRRITAGDGARPARGWRPGGDAMARVWLTDVRDGARGLLAHPRFTLVAALTLALGIGAVTTIFGVVNGLLLRPLPHPDGDRLVNVWSTAPGLGYDQFPLAPDLYLFFREHNDVFEDMTTYTVNRGNLTDGEVPTVATVMTATHTYFGTLGASFSQGRPFTDAEDLPDGPLVAVLSHRFWREDRGGDPAIIGRTLRLDGQVRQIVGVAPAWLDEPGSPDLWIPAQFDPENPPTANFSYPVIARLAPGVTAEQAERHLTPLVARALEETVQNDQYRAFLTTGQYRPLVHPLKEDLIGETRRPLWILFGTVAMVLLIACANVANLFLIRAEGRQREIAIRLALGGGRWGLVRKLLTEAMLLAGVGCALGLAIAWAGLPALISLAPPSIPRLHEVGFDGFVVAVAAGAALLSALVFGLVPAFRYTRPNVVAALRQGGRAGTEGPRRRRGRNLLVIGQTAMALVLLVGSGLLVRSFARLTETELGVRPDGVMTFRVALPQADYPDTASMARFQEDLARRLRETPGVTAAGGISVLPVEDDAPGSAFEFDGRPVASDALPPMVHYKNVSTGYFDAMGMRIEAGRGVESIDSQGDVLTVIVNRALAELYWPGEDPIGKRVRRASATADLPWMTVVGVVNDVRSDGLREPVRPLLYMPVHPARFANVMTFAATGPSAMAQPDVLRRAVWDIDPNLPVAAMRPMTEVVADSVVEFRFLMLTLGLAAGLALVLGMVGLYGVLSYAVSLRTREIGVRLALGAQPRAVMASVVGSGAMITGIGLLLGLAGAAGLTRLLGNLLFETEPLDPLTFAGMATALFVVALAASFLPARRAASVNPLESLRGE